MTKGIDYNRGAISPVSHPEDLKYFADFRDTPRPLVTQHHLDHEWVDDTTEYAGFLTVENYQKWYSIYMVDINDQVTTIDFHEVESADNGSDTVDHAINPSAFHNTAVKRNLLYDNRTFAMVCERWVEDVLDGEWTKLAEYLPKEKTPDTKDALSKLVDDVAKLSEFTHNVYDYLDDVITAHDLPPQDEVTAHIDSMSADIKAKFLAKYLTERTSVYRFNDGWDDEVGKYFISKIRSPEYTRTPEMISEGDVFEISAYLDHEGLYELENVTRPGNRSYESPGTLHKMIFGFEPIGPVTLKLAYRGDKACIRGKSIPWDEYHAMLDADHIKRSMDTGTLFLTFGFDENLPLKHHLNLDFRNVLAKVISIGERDITFQCVNIESHRKLQYAMSQFEMVVDAFVMESKVKGNHRMIVQLFITKNK